MVMQLKSFKAELLLFFIIVDLVLYYLIPSHLIPNVANGLLYAVLFVWGNTLVSDLIYETSFDMRETKTGDKERE